MATNQQTLVRQWHMLRLVPRAPAKITAQEIQSRLRDQEFTVTERTIQRDLNELLQVFPLTVDERDKPYGWSWHRDAPSFDLPGLSLPEALMVAMVEQQLRDQLPPSTLETLAPYFKSATQTLAHANGSGNARAWLNKARTVPAVQPLLAPVRNADAQDTVYNALMADRQLAIGYRKRGAGALTSYASVHPLAVVQRGRLNYLVCLFADYADIRLLAIHRVETAAMLFLPSRVPKGFSIDAYIASGALGFGAGENIVLQALFSKTAGEHLLETPLSSDQRVTIRADGRMALSATVPNTKELCWWLLGLGDGVEVVRPASIRTHLKDTAQRMQALYA